MALIDPTKHQRLEIPEEPGQWVEMRPVLVGDLRAVPVDASRVQHNVIILQRVIGAWSYAEPVNADSLDRLDADTYAWLVLQTNILGQRSDAEKKGSSDSSSSMSGPAEAVSPTSSAT